MEKLKIGVLLLPVVLWSCSKTVTSTQAYATEDPNPLSMKCMDVYDENYGLSFYRCENSEVVCYYSGGLQCKFKGNEIGPTDDP